jgi:hypothetical protein
MTMGTLRKKRWLRRAVSRIEIMWIERKLRRKLRMIRWRMRREARGQRIQTWREKQRKRHTRRRRRRRRRQQKRKRNRWVVCGHLH